MITTILPILKKLWPFALAAIVAGMSFYEGKNRGFAKGYEKAIREEIAKIKIPACPPCNCPPAVSLNGFDTDKINNKKGHFHLHNTISDVKIILNEQDSALIRELFRQARY